MQPARIGVREATADARPIKEEGARRPVAGVHRRIVEGGRQPVGDEISSLAKVVV